MELVANRSVVEHELRRALASRRANQKNSVLLLRAAPEWRGEPEFSFEDKDRQVAVTVAPCATVLAVLDALAPTGRDGQYLVVLTPCDTREVGDSVLALAMQPEIKPVNRWDLVKDAFGAVSLDPALTRKKDSRWIAEALLDAQPAGGWRRLSGTVLSRATRAEPAGRHPARHRRRRRLPGRRRRPAAVDRPTAPPSRPSSGSAKRNATGLSPGWRRPPAASPTWSSRWPRPARSSTPSPSASRSPRCTARRSRAGPRRPPRPVSGADEVFVARVRAEERYLGGTSPDVDALQAFGEAAESLVTRWADNGHAAQAAALCERAEAILAELAGTEDGGQALASRSRVLEAGLDARFTALADALGAVLAALEGRAPAAGGARRRRGGARRGPRAWPQARPRRRDPRGRRRRPGGPLARRARGDPPRRWPRARPGCSAPGPGLTVPSPQSPAPTRAGCQRSPTSTRPCGQRARARRAELDADFARKLAAWTEAPRRPTICCWWRTCSTASRARSPSSARRSSSSSTA